MSSSILFRSVQSNRAGLQLSKEEVLEIVRTRHVGSTFTSVPFMSCTADLTIATSWCQGSATKQNSELMGCSGTSSAPIGIIYKILACKRARDISAFTQTPWQKEACFLFGTRFRVTRHLRLETLLGQAQSTILHGGDVDTSSCTVAELTAPITIHNIPDVAVIELEEIGGMEQAERSPA